MSSIRSTSSRMKTSTSSRRTKPCCTRSSSRPGVATRISTPRSSALTWWCWLTPPKITVWSEAEEPPVRVDAVPDLRREFAGGSEDEGPRGVPAAGGGPGRPAAAGAAGRTPRSCRFRSGRCPAGPGPPAGAGCTAPGSAWGRRSPRRSRPAGVPGSARRKRFPVRGARRSGRSGRGARRAPWRSYACLFPVRVTAYLYPPDAWERRAAILAAEGGCASCAVAPHQGPALRGDAIAVDPTPSTARKASRQADFLQPAGRRDASAAGAGTRRPG